VSHLSVCGALLKTVVSSGSLSVFNPKYKHQIKTSYHQ
jgi:hypothetical protein